MNSPIMRLLMMVSWIITALTSLYIGLCALGIGKGLGDYVVMNMSNLVMPLQIIIGLAGLASLICFVMHVTCGCKK